MKKWTGLILIIVALLFIFSNLNNKTEREAKIEPIVPKYEYGILVDSFNVVKATVKKNQTFGEILYSNHIDHLKIARLDWH